jgi:hypothetical protein
MEVLIPATEGVAPMVELDFLLKAPPDMEVVPVVHIIQEDMVVVCLILRNISGSHPFTRFLFRELPTTAPRLWRSRGLWLLGGRVIPEGIAREHAGPPRPIALRTFRALSLRSLHIFFSVQFFSISNYQSLPGIPLPPSISSRLSFAHICIWLMMLPVSRFDCVYITAISSPLIFRFWQ